MKTTTFLSFILSLSTSYCSCAAQIKEVKVQEIACSLLHQNLSLSAVYGSKDLKFVPETKSPAYLNSFPGCHTGKDLLLFPPELIPKNFDGFEAAVTLDQALFLTIETKSAKSTQAYLVKAPIAASKHAFEIQKMVLIPLKTQAYNRGVEALTSYHGKLYAIEELNFPPHNSFPAAHIFDSDLRYEGTIPFPTIPFRITDATPADTDGKFWAINYFWPGDHDLLVKEDPLAITWGKGPSHLRYQQIERLVQFQILEKQITLVNRAPVYLELADKPRKWEAIAQLNPTTFVLATDTLPRTIIAKVELPDEKPLSSTSIQELDTLSDKNSQIAARAQK